MSVIVNGMKMPQRCLNCPFEERYSDANYHCLANRGAVIEFDLFGNGKNCPLVEIKTPHGRLIDADANVAVLNKVLEEVESACQRSLLSYAAAIMKECPTIIEAEEGVNNG